MICEGVDVNNTVFFVNCDGSDLDGGISHKKGNVLLNVCT